MGFVRIWMYKSWRQNVFRKWNSKWTVIVDIIIKFFNGFLFYFLSGMSIRTKTQDSLSRKTKGELGSLMGKVGFSALH